MTDDKVKETELQYQSETAQHESKQPLADEGAQEITDPTELAMKELEKENLRLRADMENLRKRAHKDKIEFARYANENLLCEIVPVIDNFERATQVNVEDPELKKFLTGFSMIQSQLEQVLKNAGLEKIEALNQPFDPNVHEAVETVADPAYENDTVVELLRAGYLFNEKVIRPALVKVAKN